MKKLLLFILLGAVIGLTFVQYFDHYLSADISFFREAAEKSDGWAAGLRKSDTPCYVICGSSDVRMGVDPEVMMAEEGVRAINVSLNAGYGQNLLVLEALRSAREGDTIVYAPLCDGNEPDAILTNSMKLGFMRHGLGVFEPGLISCSPGNVSKIFSGDVSTILINLTKGFTGRTHRYNAETCIIHESGWVELLPVLHNADKIRVKPYPLDKPLSKGAQTPDISILAEKAREKGCRLLIQIPTLYQHESWQAVGAWTALHYTRLGYSVLKDPDFGVVTDPALVADTNRHLNAKGAREHSLLMARLLKEGAFWTEEELVEELRKRGWNADGTHMPAPAVQEEQAQAEEH